MRHYIKEVVPQDDYTLRLVFDPDEVRIFDMTPHFVGVLVPLSDPETFKDVRIARKGRKLVWLDDFDFCADMLYEESVPVTTESLSLSWSRLMDLIKGSRQKPKTAKSG